MRVRLADERYTRTYLELCAYLDNRFLNRIFYFSESFNSAQLPPDVHLLYIYLCDSYLLVLNPLLPCYDKNKLWSCCIIHYINIKIVPFSLVTNPWIDLRLSKLWITIFLFRLFYWCGIVKLYFERNLKTKARQSIIITIHKNPFTSFAIVMFFFVVARHLWLNWLAKMKINLLEPTD